MKTKLLSLLSVLTFINTNAQIGFQESTIIDETHGVLNIESVFSADIDGDGYKDVISASKDDNKIAWYKNIGGSGEFGEQKVIYDNAIEASSVFAIDIDGDGDIDVLSSSRVDNTIAWYENIDGLGNFSNQKTIDNEASYAWVVSAKDIDNDGDIDVLSASSGTGKVVWYENNGSGSFDPKQIIDANTLGVRALYPGDIDGDNDVDIVIASYNNDEIAWYENLNGQGAFSPKKVVANNIKRAQTVFSADLDSDGDMDILSTSWEANGRLVWFENLDGQGSFSSYKQIASNRGGESLLAEDLDGDGDIDILDSDIDGFRWYENIDGNANFVVKQELHSNHSTDSNFIIDLNNDTYPDIITGFESSEISWFKNIDGKGTFELSKTIARNTNSPNKIIATDIDGDGDLDISCKSNYNKTAWYENIDGLGNFGIQNIISVGGGNDDILFNADMDGDDDIDIITFIALTFNTGKLVWYENTDGKGDFSVSHNIFNDVADMINVNDVDGDGDLDVICYNSYLNRELKWYENIDGKGNFGLEQIFFQENINLTNLNSCDIDGDGDIDVISSHNGFGGSSSHILLFENIDGNGTFSSKQTISTNELFFIAISFNDLDNDDDLDIAFVNHSGVFWLENIDGNGVFGEPKIIDTYESITSSIFKQIDIKDIDGDGDSDLLHNNGGTSFWYENIDGIGNFGVKQVISNIEGSFTSMSTGDINNDNKEDIFYGFIGELIGSSSTSKIVLHKNLGLDKNEIKGIVRLDVDNDGCDDNDLVFPNLMIVTDNGTESLATFSLNNGFYQLFPEEGDFITEITSMLPDYYSATPSSHNSNFTGIGNSDTSNFCLVPNQSIKDLNILLLPITEARPGFDASYQLVFHNVGTTQLHGDIILEFDDSKLTFLNSSDTIFSQTANSLTFNYRDLNPFETRTIDLNFNVIAPPTTNIGDVLSFTATINPVSGDYTENDNVFELNQTVIGSYDPNDIRVLEGSQILVEDTEDYLHYIIRFQNTGTASAINVRVENILDINLDWDTIQLENISHANRVEIKDGNQVSFIFNGIYLPDSTKDEPNSHGFIAYKIKPKDGITVGEIMQNKADIYFDFNLPIITNTVSTQVASALSVDDNRLSTFTVSPNPTKDVLNVKSQNSTVAKLELYNNIGQIVFSILNENQIDVSSLTSGLYFIKIEDNYGNTETKKIVKK